jgi:hypothetical protein
VGEVRFIIGPPKPTTRLKQRIMKVRERGYFFRAAAFPPLRPAAFF